MPEILTDAPWFSFDSFDNRYDTGTINTLGRQLISNMYHCKTFFVISVIAWLSFASNSQASTIFHAQYTANYSGTELKVSRKLSINADDSLRLQLKGAGGIAKIEEMSQFTRENGEFLPLHYRYKRKIFGMGRTDNIHFDWSKNQAAFHKGRKKNHTIHSLEPDVLDAALYQLKLQQDLFQGRDQLRYRYVQKDKIRQREFIRQDLTEYTLNGTTYKALRLTREGGKASKTTEILVIPELFYQIAYIKQTQSDGDTYETRLTHFDFDREALTALYSSESKKLQ